MDSKIEYKQILKHHIQTNIEHKFQIIPDGETIFWFYFGKKIGNGPRRFYKFFVNLNPDNRHIWIASQYPTCQAQFGVVWDTAIIVVLFVIILFRTKVVAYSLTNDTFQTTSICHFCTLAKWQNSGLPTKYNAANP